MQAKITMDLIEQQRATAIANQSVVFLWDTDIIGFGVKITPKERVSWLAQCWIGGASGRPKRTVIGHWPNLKIAEARTAARVAIGQIADGIDVGLRKKARIAKQQAWLASPTLDAAYRAWFKRIDDGSRYRAENDRFWSSHIKSVLGKSPIIQITRRDLKSYIDSLPHLGQRRRAFAILGPLYRWLIDEELVTDNPMLTLRSPTPPSSRDRTLRPAELTLVWQASEKMRYPWGPFFKLLLLTAQRRDEVAGMQWRELEAIHDTHTEPLWTIPASRTKTSNIHLVPLSPLAVQIIKSIPERTSYVFITRANKYGKLQGYSKSKKELDDIMEALDLSGEPITPWTLHDLRRTFATYANEKLHYPPHVIDKALNHQIGNKVSRVYNRAEYLTERRNCLNDWADYIMNLVTRADKSTLTPT